MKQTEQNKLAQQIKSVLDQSVKDIDADTQYQLQLARVKALQSKDVVKRWYQSKSIWASVASLASVSVLVVLISTSPLEYPVSGVDMMSNMDGLLFETDESIELYEQYDFYV